MRLDIHRAMVEPSKRGKWRVVTRSAYTGRAPRVWFDRVDRAELRVF